MFNQEQYSKTRKIISRIKEGVNISITERIYLQDFADKNPEIFSKLKQAQYHRRLNNTDQEELTDFMSKLGLDGTCQNEHFNPRRENIGEWFSNAPKWLRRS